MIWGYSAAVFPIHPLNYGFDSGIEPVSARIDPEAVSRIKLATKIWENLESESVQ